MAPLFCEWSKALITSLFVLCVGGLGDEGLEPGTGVLPTAIHLQKKEQREDV